MTISDCRVSIFVIGALLGAPITVGVADSVPGGGGLAAYYRQHVHGRASGVYEQDGWVFFHQRVRMNGDVMFGQVAAMRSAIGNVNKDLQAMLSGREACAPVSYDPALSEIKRLVEKFGAEKPDISRSIENLRVRVLCQEPDGDDYVYDMAVRALDLETEAVVGRPEDRSLTIERSWRDIVRSRIDGEDCMSFVRDCGAMDLWTLKSAERCGMKELIAARGEDESCCRECIRDLAESVSRTDCDGASDYGSLLKGLYCNLTNELAGSSGSLTNRMVRIVLLSFGCCMMPRQKERVADLDTASFYIDQDNDVKVTVEVFARLAGRTPGSYMYWMALGKALIRDGKCYLALSCFRNALRLRMNDGYALDALAMTYENLGYEKLARGAALLAFAMVDDADVTDRARRILSEK